MSSAHHDERIAKRADSGDARTNRLSLDRAVTENRENTDGIRNAERHAMLRDVNTLLPVPPPIDGYHLVWLTTTNSKDSLEQRFRLGYTLVKPEELPDFRIATQKSGEVIADRIQINEMVLAKIPMELWLQDLQYLHHDLPAQQVNSLKDSVRFMQDGKGRDVAYTGGEFKNGATEGYAMLGRNKAPNFAGIQ